MSNYCFVAPILPGGAEKMKNWVKTELTSKGHDEFMASAGVSREQIWIQNTPMGDFAVVSLEVVDPTKATNAFATSTSPWAAKFRTFVKDAHGIDISKPQPINVQIGNWNGATQTVKATR